MYKLKDSEGKIHLENETHDNVWKYIREYAKSKENGYYYIQNPLENGNIWIDYGSHTHFFILEELK
jgi:hypothetical protein